MPGVAGSQLISPFNLRSLCDSIRRALNKMLAALAGAVSLFHTSELVYSIRMPRTEPRSLIRGVPSGFLSTTKASTCHMTSHQVILDMDLRTAPRFLPA